MKYPINSGTDDVEDYLNKLNDNLNAASQLIEIINRVYEIFSNNMQLLEEAYYEAYRDIQSDKIETESAMKYNRSVIDTIRNEMELAKDRMNRAKGEMENCNARMSAAAGEMSAVNPQSSDAQSRIFAAQSKMGAAQYDYAKAQAQYQEALLRMNYLENLRHKVEESNKRLAQIMGEIIFKEKENADYLERSRLSLETLHNSVRTIQSEYKNLQSSYEYYREQGLEALIIVKSIGQSLASVSDGSYDGERITLKSMHALTDIASTLSEEREKVLDNNYILSLSVKDFGDVLSDSVSTQTTEEINSRSSGIAYDVDDFTDMSDNFKKAAKALNIYIKL